MELFIQRTPHIAKHIFDQLDNKSLKNCQEVNKLWMKFISNKNMAWLRIIKFPEILKYRDTYLHIAAKYGQSTIFENVEINNEKDIHGFTPMHLVCKYGHFKIVEILTKKPVESGSFGSTKMSLLLNENNLQYYGEMGVGETPFQIAVKGGQTKIVELLVQNSAKFNLKLNVPFSLGKVSI